MGPSQVLIPPGLREEVADNLRRSFARLFGPGFDYPALAKDFLDPARVGEQLEGLFSSLGLQPGGQRLLEVGSGFGMLVAVAQRDFGLQARGLEPADEQFKGTLALSRRLLAANGMSAETIQAGAGEAMPFADNSFDLVYSCNVLEHVADPARVVAEALRVTRPGGYVQMVFPNYGSFWEGHYGILWIPRLSHFWGRLYLRLLGKDPQFLGTLHLLNYRHVQAILAGLRGQVEVLDLGQDLWARRVRQAAVADYAFLGRLRRWVLLLHRLGLVELVVRLGIRWHWQTPFVLTLRKVGQP